MTHKLPNLKAPTSNIIKKYNGEFKSNKRYNSSDKSVIKLFKKFKQNKNIEDILLKTSVINDLYSTNILDTFKIAGHILSLKIDRALEKGDPKIVNKIASGHGIKNKKTGKELNFYSFATKYCYNHNPEKYAMYDSFVSKILKAYRKKTNFYDFRNEDFKDYVRFLEVLDEFKEYFKLNGFSFKEIDRFLWIYGKKLFLKNKK